SGGNGGTISVTASGGTYLLAELNTKRLTMTTEFVGTGNIPNMVVRLGGTEIARPINGGGTFVGFNPTINYPFKFTIAMDG
ncbi:hypothetical protein ABTM28_21180, partial [Acinetobacter baumannii]